MEKKKRHPGRPKKKGPWPKCKARKCSRTTQNGAKGFCHTHYVAARREQLDMKTGTELRPRKRVSSYGLEAQCSVKECNNRPKANGLCHGHWQRKRNGRKLGPLLPRKKAPYVPCLMRDCHKRAMSKGMCSQHAEKRRRGLIDGEGNKLRDPMKGGRKPKERRYAQGYALVRAPKNHPRARKDGSIFEHRLVMEKRLGRHLGWWEIVHHKDGVRDNNDISNLELYDGRARNGKGHHPAHGYDLRTAVQIVLQQELPTYLCRGLEAYLKRLEKTSV